MKILLLNADLGYGGAEKMIAWLANTLVRNGNEVTFLTYRNKTYNYQTLDDNIRRDFLPTENKRHSLKEFIKTIVALNKNIRENNYDVAIGFLKPSQIRLYFATRMTKTQLLFSQRGDPYRINQINGKERIIENIIKYFFCKADGFVFQTKGAMSYYSSKVQEKAIIIPNIVPPIKRTQEREGNVKKEIVSVARLDIKQKRQDLLISAFNQISPLYPQYRLLFYGSGPDLESLQNLAINNDKITFMGITNDVISSIQNSSIFVLSSDYEGIPNALLEAMSLGVPCISTDCSPGGAAMVIENRVNGLLVPRGDANLLANALKCYLDNPDFAERCGKSAMSICEKYTEAHISREWLDFVGKYNRKHDKYN